MRTRAAAGRWETRRARDTTLRRAAGSRSLSGDARHGDSMRRPPREGTAMRTLLSAAVVLLAGLAQALAQGSAPSAEVMRELAPTGKLRAAINFGNVVLAQKGPAGEPKGITPDLATELGKRLGVPVEFVPYDAAGKVFEGAKANAWDIAFIAIEPARATEIEFTAPYVIIEGTYMVAVNSPLKEIADVDKPGIRIAVARASAYDLYLTRTVKNATVVRAAVGGGRAMIELFVNDKLEVAAGVRQQLEAYAKGRDDVRIMSGRFMEIQQAMGTPKGRLAGAAYLRTFVADAKASGFVAGAIARAGQTASVAP
jgi:polar amino acid transport system substrate-binding protein